MVVATKASRRRLRALGSARGLGVRGRWRFAFPDATNPRLSGGPRGLAAVSGETRCDPDKVNIPAHPG
jgi:hypothetical protein